jgi:N-acetylated-alpha-linked acidic dipeptidase
MVSRLLSVCCFLLVDFMVTIAWVMGAADPISGTVSLLEIVRGFGALLRKGWKPLRTGECSSGNSTSHFFNNAFVVVIASWDAEEVGVCPSIQL